MDENERAQRLRQARIEAGYATAREAAISFGWNLNTYSSNENGNAPFSFRKAGAYAKAFGVKPTWLYAMDDDAGMRPRTAAHAGAEAKLVPVIGRVGADAEGVVMFATGQETGDLVPLPPGGGDNAVALQVRGSSMRGLIDDGGLIYFEHQRTPPTPDMLGQVVVVETQDDEVLVKRLLRGSRRGLYDLESIAGPTLRDRKLRWAAHITAIIPPFQARKVLRAATG